MTTDDLFDDPGISDCGIRLTIAALAIEGFRESRMTIGSLDAIANRHFRGSSMGKCHNRQSNGAINQSRIVNKSSIPNPQSSLDADVLAPAPR